MAGRILNEDVVAVREGARIDEVVREYLTLVNAGGGSLKGLCPFHDEKTPSFHVTPSRNLWYCFGCAEGGDVIDFVQRVEQMTFAEAVERLAARAGISLRYEALRGGVGGSASDGASKDKRARLVAANVAAAAYYAEKLGEPQASGARDFLRSRGIDEQVARRFEIGFAPLDRDGVVGHLSKAGFSENEIVSAGVGVKGERGVVDRFRGRVIFTIKDARGDVIGFGGRKLDDSDQGPKYLNTSETPLYKKSTVLYGLDLARKPIANAREVVVVEGYTDVIACHLAGVENVVATCGTAFGEGHVRVLRRFLANAPDQPASVIFTFDGDEAGAKASVRAFEFEREIAAQTYVAIESDGLDPCDVRLKKSDEALRDLIRGRVPLVDFVIRQAVKDFDLGSPAGRVQASKAVGPLLAKVSDQVLRNQYVDVAAGIIGIEPSQLRGVLSHAPQTRGGTSSVSVGVAFNLEREALKAVMQFPDYVGEYLSEIRPELFEAEAPVKLAAAVQQALTKREGGDARFWADLMQDSLSDEATTKVFKALYSEPMQGDVTNSRYARSVCARLLESRMIARTSEIRSQMQRAAAAGDAAEESRLLGELMATEARRRALWDEAQGAA
ncbi:MAG: DNA primase [Gammaproteobacteria bacterium]|nr:DNA primase [Gammaproteobacteria bacterium]